MGGWDAVVDVSNVCWDKQLPPRGCHAPVWSRLGLVAAAWRRQHGNTARLHLVADRTLVRDVDNAWECGRLLNARELVTVPHADLEILALARDRSLHVITRDRYLQHRAEHPWIAESPERFHSWRYSHGKVTIVPRGIEWVRPPDAATREGTGTATGIPPGNGTREALRPGPHHPRYPDLAGVRWQCGSTRCPEGHRGHLLVVPAVSAAGEPRCPACGGQLRDRGQRRREFHEVVVEDLAAQAEIARFVLESDEVVTIGGAQTGAGLNLGRYAGPRLAATVARVRKQHVKFGVQMPRPGLRRMVVTDLWSGGGTTVQHPSATGLGQPKSAEPGRETPVLDGGRVILAEAVVLRFPAA